MTDGKKQFFVTDKLVAFLFLNLIPKKVRPNHITICRFVLTPIVIFLFLRHHYFWGGLTFLIAALTDLLDGMVARQRRQITNLGKILDPLADKLLILSVFLVLVIPCINIWILGILFLVEFLFIVGAVIYRQQGLHPQANIWGKIKMNLEVWGIIFILFGLILHAPLFITLSSALFILAIIFGLTSLISHGI